MKGQEMLIFQYFLLFFAKWCIIMVVAKAIYYKIRFRIYKRRKKHYDFIKKSVSTLGF